MRPMSFLLGSFLRELESQLAFFSTRVGTPEADSCAFFSLTVHDLATLLTGHADHAPYVEARVLPAGVLFFLRELESQVISTRFATGSPKPLVGTSEADFLRFFFPVTVHDRPCRLYARCGGPRSSFFFERAGESGDFNPFAGSPNPLACRRLTLVFFPVTVHDLATLLTGHADYMPDVEARVLHAGDSGDFNPFAGSPSPLTCRRLTLVFFPVRVHDLATLLTGHADHTPRCGGPSTRLLLACPTHCRRLTLFFL